MSTTRKQVALVITVVATVAIAAAVARRRNAKERNRRRTQRILRKFARDCATPVSKLWKVADALVHDMDASLSGGNSHEATTLNMVVSYASSLPNGDESGRYYGVNLRGANFLILCAKLRGKNEPVSDLLREDISIPSNVLASNSQELFDYITSELAKFIAEHPQDDANGTQGTEKKLGFTISYMEGQDTLAGTFCSPIKWKSLSADDSVAKELTNDFNQRLKRCGLNMRVFAPVDETTAQLAGGRYYNKDVVAAVRLASTINAAYLEPADSVAIWNGPPSDNTELVMNLDLGNFSSCHLPVTEFDASLDAESSSPGRQIFQKLISATHLGEIVRRVLLKMAQEAALFGYTVPSKLAIPFLLKSHDMAAMHQDTSEDHAAVSQKLEEIFGITNTTPMARETVVEVCDIVAERGARLAGAAIVAIVKKLGRIENRRSVVTVEGGLYDHYRVFRNYLHSSVWEMLGDDLSDNVVLEHSHGGLGAGSLFLAASQTCNPAS